MIEDLTKARILARPTELALESGSKGEDDTLLTLERVGNEHTCSKLILSGDRAQAQSGTPAHDRQVSRF
jgi:hypothetical protein